MMRTRLLITLLAGLALTGCPDSSDKESVTSFEQAAKEEPSPTKTGTPEPEGRKVPVFDGKDIAGWGVTGSWEVRNGVLVARNPGQRPMQAWFHDRHGGKQLFVRDCTLRFEFQIHSGKLVAQLRMPLGKTSKRPVEIRLTRREVGAGWHRASVTLKGPRADYTIDGSMPRQVDGDGAREGVVNFRCEAGDAFEVRKVALWVTTPGSASPKPVSGPPSGGRTKPLFDGDLSKWEIVSPSWKVKGDVIHGDAEAHRPAQVNCGSTEWKNYRVRFEVRKLSGNLSVALRRADRLLSHVEINEGDLPERDEWYKVEIVIFSSRVLAWIHGARVFRKFRTVTRQGGVGFRLSRGSDCQLRNLEVELLE